LTKRKSKELGRTIEFILKTNTFLEVQNLHITDKLLEELTVWNNEEAPVYVQSLRFQIAVY
jgi:hypothetical protein